MFKLIFATFSLLILASPVHAGTIRGEVKYSGKVPPPIVHKTGKFAKVCGSEILEESLILKNQKVKNAVIWLEGKQAKKLKNTPGTYTIDQNLWVPTLVIGGWVVVGFVLSFILKSRYQA